MPTGPQRSGGNTPIRNNNRSSIYGVWHGGPNYAGGEPEEFSSKAHAKRVFQSRMEGYDPVQGLRTPLVQDSEMHLYSGHPDEGAPFHAFKQTRRGIRSERL
jgi:hypothetical protein